MGRRVASLVIVLLLSGIPAVRAAAPVVARVELNTDSRMDRQELMHVLGLAIGKPLDRVRLRQGIRALYAGGNVESLSVESTSTDEGLSVSVTVRTRARIAALSIRGVGLLWRTRIQSWLHVHRGDAFSTAAVQSAARRIERELESRSYINATVEPEVDYRPADNTVAVTYTVSLGEAARASAVRLEGVADPEHKLADAARLKQGKKLSMSRIDRVTDRIEAALRAAGYWEAEVLDTKTAPAPGGFDLVLRVDSGPKYRLKLKVAKAEEETARRALPWAKAGQIHPAQTSAVAEQVRTALQSLGYLLATVDAQLKTEGSTPTLVLDVKVGPRCRIEEVQFPGGTHLRAKKMRRAVAVHPGKLGGTFGATVTAATLEEDRLALEKAFRKKGFADVAVARARIEDLGGGAVRVVFPVSEGRRWTVKKMAFVGFPVEVAPVIESEKLPLAEGGPWDPNALEATRRRLELALENHGYPDAEVKGTVDTRVSGSAVVTLTAVPGDFVTLSEVVVAGLHVTRESVVRGVLDRAGLRAGIPYSLDTILTAQRKLYELGLFRRVDIIPIPGQERLRRRGLVVRCSEGLQRSYLLGGGWDTTNKMHITFGWSHLNLFGGAHALSLQARLSAREKTYRATLREPNVPWVNVPAYASIYRTFEDFSSHSQTRRGFWIDLGYRRRRPFRLWWRYEYQIVDPHAPPDILSELERENQRARIASLTPTAEWDTRDDPFLPTRGIFAALSVQYAFPIVNADARFVKALANFSLYGHLPGGTGALGVRLGAITPIANRSTAPENLQIPISVRFFAGGSASNRAFATDQLGIPGQTIDDRGRAIGGNALALLNLEYRRKIRGPVSAVLFVDSGNVWASVSDVSWNDMRWGIGLGLRLDTPAGPLRLDYGRKLHRRAGESGGEIFLAFGTPF